MNATKPLATQQANCPVTREAAERLGRSAYRPVRSVSCSFDQGVLVLVGRMQSYYHKQLAQEAVARLDGVRRVRNEIEVQPAV